MNLKKESNEIITTIAYIHNKTDISGGERSLLNLWKNLDRSRFRPLLILPNEGNFFDEAKKHNIQVETLPIPKISFTKTIEILWSIIKLKRILSKSHAKIIHSYTPRNNIIAAFIGKCFDIRVIWHERNLVYGSEMDISKKLLFLPDKVICNSRAVAERFKKKEDIPSKVKVVLNGVDIKKFSPKYANLRLVQRYNLNGKKVVGIVSNLNRRKKVEYFIEACPLILKNYSNTHFLIVGGEFGDTDIGRKKELEERVKILGLENYVTFTGFLSNIDDIIRIFDIGVNVTEKEACSRAILEIMASGKPVVAFDTGGNSEIVEHNVTGRLVKFRDIPHLAKSISDLLKDNEKREAMGKYARKIAKTKFDIKINTKQTEEIYSELV